jgi:hypothetical protein
MKNILVLSMLLFSCNNVTDDKVVFKTVTEIDYTFDSGWKEAYSIKINADGKCIIGDGRWDIKYYVGQLSGITIQSLDSLIERIPFKQYDSTYTEDVVDQSSYKFFITNINKDTAIKFIYGRTAPKLLNDLSNRLRKIKEELKLIEKDTAIDFISRKKFFPATIKATE